MSPVPPARAEGGYATILTLVIVVLASALAAQGQLWALWSARGAEQFQDRFAQVQVARHGVALGLSRLLDDTSTGVDWLGEEWALPQELVHDGIAVRVEVTDEGSKIGMNWADAALLRAALDLLAQDEGGSDPSGGHGLPDAAAWIAGVRAERVEAFFSSFADLERRGGAELAPGLWEAWATPLALFNVNAVDDDVLEAFWRSMGVDEERAREIAEEIREYRAENVLIPELDLLLDASLTLRREEYERARKWLTVAGPVNINTAPLETLRVMLAAAGHDPAQAEAFDAARRERARGISELRAILGGASSSRGDAIPLDKWVTVRSSVFRISSALVDYPVKVEALVRRIWDEQESAWRAEILSWRETR